MPVLFALTLFVSALLLFMVQPMVGRMVLPLLGGSPAAWNTCMVFFQFVLLLGYLYAHKLTARFQPRQQVIIHLGVLIAALAVLGVSSLMDGKHSPIAVVRSLAPQGSSYPMFGVLALLAVAIGVPFFAVSTSAPLLQRWFAYTGHPAARDPYFLYAASNAGSLISLLAYPLFTEPSYTLLEQAWLWTKGFATLLLLAGMCGWLALRMQQKSRQVNVSDVIATTPPTLVRKLKWILLAFVPSSLMLGVTTHMTTDIASIPLLWIIPLALYLLTFVIAFATTPKWLRPVLGNVSPVLSLLLVFVIITSSQWSSDRAFLMIILHNLAYFFAALMCHYELAHDRPHLDHLTGFYLCMSIGGVLGGAFNALVAPLVFPLAYEYPIAIAIGCMLVPKLSAPRESDGSRDNNASGRLLDIFIPCVMLAGVAGLTLLPEWQSFYRSIIWLADQVSNLCQTCGLNVIITRQNMLNMVCWALPLMISFFFIDRPLRFGLCVAAILVVYEVRDKLHGESQVVRTERSFFGIIKVEEHNGYRRLVHGTTLHGTQASQTRITIADELMRLGVVCGWEAIGMNGAIENWDLRQEPLTYYHRTGPVGHLFSVSRGAYPNGHVAMVGLGTGSVSCYAGKGQTLTFYEIDPTVKKLVADTDQYFTYVSGAKARGADIEFIMGDARLELEAQADRKYEMLLVDAFSSDSIPIHLLTTSAVKLYSERIRDDGLIALHVSNKFVKLDLVVEAIRKELGLAALIFNDSWNDDIQSAPAGKTQSSWIVLAKDPKYLDSFHQEMYTTNYPYMTSENAELKAPTHAWQKIAGNDVVKPWTDDYADVMMVMMIKEIQQLRHFSGLPTVSELRE